MTQNALRVFQDGGSFLGKKLFSSCFCCFCSFLLLLHLMMPTHWNCFVAGCKSNFSSKVEGLKYYRIPKKFVKQYDAFFKTDQVNWKTVVICSLHWSSERKNFNHLPDIRIPVLWRDKTMPVKRKQRSLPYLRSSSRSKTTRLLTQKVTRLKDGNKEFVNEIDRFQSEVSDLEIKLDKINKENDLLRKKNKALEEKKNELESKVVKINLEKERAEEMLRLMKEENRGSFHWYSIKAHRFVYLCGLERNDFITFFNCFEPYLHLMIYESCKGSTDIRRKWSKENELFASLIICRHALHLGIMAWIMDISESTMCRIFEAWMTFGHAVFSKIDLAHPKLLIDRMMPTAYKNLGYSHIVLVLDATEFKVTGLSDLLLNQLFFSDYKNTHTVKALACLTPHGSAAKIPELFPGSITDSTLTDMVGALDNILCHDGVLTDKGFAISEQLAAKGGIQNRPPMKSAPQFTTGECDANFKIACLRIHVERWIGYLRDYAILNTVWPSPRVDLLNSVWIFLANLVNLTSKVGPKQ